MKKVLAIILSFIIIITSMLVVTSPAFAWSWASGKHWSTGYAYYDTSALPTNWENEIIAAAQTWNNSASSFAFGWTSSSTNDLVTQYSPGFTLAWTAAYANDQTLHIYEAHTTFNTVWNYSTTGGSGTYDVQSVALHELGHWLVLDDLYGFWDQWKIMYGYYHYDRSLSSDDINGICYIYP